MDDFCRDGFGFGVQTASKLEQVKEEIVQHVKEKKKRSIKVMTFAADLTNVTDEMLERFSTMIRDLDVGILVNRDLISINTYAPTALTSAVLPGMKARHRGFIVNVGSANGILPAVPLLSIYAGSKAYINQFSRSMDEELKPFNVRVQDQCPFFVTTKISKIRKPRIDAPTPKAWAKSAVKQIGYETDRTPYWSHGLMLLAIQSLCPVWAINGYVHSLHASFRNRYYRKQAKLAAEKKSE
eukprot:jgi/Picre1/34809/NNA_002275.t1